MEVQSVIKKFYGILNPTTFENFSNEDFEMCIKIVREKYIKDATTKATKLQFEQLTLLLNKVYLEKLKRFSEKKDTSLFERPILEMWIELCPELEQMSDLSLKNIMDEVHTKCLLLGPCFDYDPIEAKKQSASFSDHTKRYTFECEDFISFILSKKPRRYVLLQSVDNNNFLTIGYGTEQTVTYTIKVFENLFIELCYLMATKFERYNNPLQIDMKGGGVFRFLPIFAKFGRKHILFPSDSRFYINDEIDFIEFVKHYKECALYSPSIIFTYEITKLDDKMKYFKFHMYPSEREKACFFKLEDVEETIPDGKGGVEKRKYSRTSFVRCLEIDAFDASDMLLNKWKLEVKDPISIVPSHIQTSFQWTKLCESFKDSDKFEECFIQGFTTHLDNCIHDSRCPFKVDNKGGSSPYRWLNDKTFIIVAKHCSYDQFKLLREFQQARVEDWDTELVTSFVYNDLKILEFVFSWVPIIRTIAYFEKFQNRYQDVNTLKAICYKKQVNFDRQDLERVILAVKQDRNSFQKHIGQIVQLCTAQEIAYIMFDAVRYISLSSSNFDYEALTDYFFKNLEVFRICFAEAGSLYLEEYYFKHSELYPDRQEQLEEWCLGNTDLSQYAPSEIFKRKMNRIQCSATKIILLKRIGSEKESTFVAQIEYNDGVIEKDIFSFIPIGHSSEAWDYETFKNVELDASVMVGMIFLRQIANYRFKRIVYSNHLYQDNKIDQAFYHARAYHDLISGIATNIIINDFDFYPCGIAFYIDKFLKYVKERVGEVYLQYNVCYRQSKIEDTWALMTYEKRLIELVISDPHVAYTFTKRKNRDDYILTFVFAKKFVDSDKLSDNSSYRMGFKSVPCPKIPDNIEEQYQKDRENINIISSHNKN